VRRAEEDLELSGAWSRPGQLVADACARWVEVTERAEAEYCQAARMPGCGWLAWINHEPVGRHDHLMRLRARLFAGYGPG
jgi:hypothetical protein